MTPSVAQVVHDNGETRVAGGVRALDGDGRQLVFRHGGVQVELMLQTGRPGPVVWGKVLREDTGMPCPGARTTLLGGAGETSAATRTDAWGEFWLATAGDPHTGLRVEYGGDEFVCCIATRERPVAPVTEEPALR
jgi:hypothetical protein